METQVSTFCRSAVIRDRNDVKDRYNKNATKDIRINSCSQSARMSDNTILHYITTCYI